MKRLAEAAARSIHREIVLRERLVMRAMAEMRTPSTRMVATCSNSSREQRRPAYAVAVLVLKVRPQVLQRHRWRGPDFVLNEACPMILPAPSFPTSVQAVFGHALFRIGSMGKGSARSEADAKRM